MKPSEKNLQRENFKDAMLIMASVPGWIMLEEDGFLAIKAPTKLAFINFVWADASLANIKKAKQFYGNKSFSWVLKPEQNAKNLIAGKFNAPEPIPEMVLDLFHYHSKQHSDDIKIIEVNTEKDFTLWTEVAGKVFHFPAADISEFFKPLIDIAGDIPFLALYKGKPAATAMIFSANKTVGIYAMGVLPEFRRSGIGRAILDTCLCTAKNQHMQQAVLSASSTGKLLYQSMDFVVSQNFNEYFFDVERVKTVHEN